MNLEETGNASLDEDQDNVIRIARPNCKEERLMQDVENRDWREESSWTLRQRKCK
jgi:hypothetical protein